MFDTKQQFCYLLVVSSLTLTVPFNRACLEIRNEEVINSKRNRISSLKVFQVLLNYRRSSIPQDIYFIRRFVSELIEYACINTRITQGPRFEKNK